jgi:hypothetical protein
VDACSYILSRLVLNGAASRGLDYSGTYLALEDPMGVATGVRVHAESGYTEELQWADSL